jgi:hypothetical protein
MPILAARGRSDRFFSLLQDFLELFATRDAQNRKNDYLRRFIVLMRKARTPTLRELDNLTHSNLQLVCERTSLKQKPSRLCSAGGFRTSGRDDQTASAGQRKGAVRNTVVIIFLVQLC